MFHFVRPALRSFCLLGILPASALVGCGLDTPPLAEEPSPALVDDEVFEGAEVVPVVGEVDFDNGLEIVDPVLDVDVADAGPTDAPDDEDQDGDAADAS